MYFYVKTGTSGWKAQIPHAKLTDIFLTTEDILFFSDWERPLECQNLPD